MTDNTRTLFYRFIFCGIVGVQFGAFSDAVTEPWTLRDHYNFAGKDSTLQLDAKRAEWRVVADQKDTTVEAAYTEIVLGNGTRARLTQSNWISDGREDFKDAFGAGMRFHSEFKPLDGLLVEYHVNRYNAQSFITMVIIVHNTGPSPISIKAIRHGVVDQGALARVRPGEIVLNRSTRRGTHTVLQEKGQTDLANLRVEGTSGLFGLGLLQSGYMQSTINLTESSSSLSGSIESDFSPPILVMPGGSAQSDPMWMMVSADDEVSIINTHVYSLSHVQRNHNETIFPNGWMTVPDGSSSAELVSAASKWHVDSISNVLVPLGWQTYSGKPSINMGSLSKDLRDAGMNPGLTVDPLRADKSIRGITTEAEDGSHWYDISKPEAREHATKNLRQLVSWKYNFFVVALTQMPDEILSSMNVTRSIADRVSFELLQEAVGNLPVIPTSGMTLGNNLAEWNAAALATSANTPFGLLTGSVRLDVRGVEELSVDVNEAIGRYAGPVEIVGSPGKKMRDQLSVSVPKTPN